MKDSLLKIAKNFPSDAGVYIFSNKDQTLYVGKAKNLKNRIKSYCREDDKRSMRIAKMIENATDLNYLVVDTELEAFMLETNLIKEKKPKYNVLMKDDKNYCYIKITQNEDYPRLLVVRKKDDDGSLYFGPKSSAFKVRETIDLLHKIYKFRNCGLNITCNEVVGEKVNVTVKNKVINYPCLEYHIERCGAPCIGLVKPEDYNQNISKIVKFLSGDQSAVIAELKARIERAVESKNFELAIKFRDTLFAIQDVQEKQKISDPSFKRIDMISFVVRLDKAFFNVFNIRDGKLINQENFLIDTKLANLADENDKELLTEILENFIYFYYSSSTDFPNDILVDDIEVDLSLVEDYLKMKSGRKISIRTSQRGHFFKLFELCQKNAINYARQSEIKWDSDEKRTTGAISELAEYLQIADENGEFKKLKRIECFDISHLSGSDTVASMVVFENGKPKSSDYRHFIIRSLQQTAIDDFKSIYEVVKRRVRYFNKKKALKFKFSEAKGQLFVYNESLELCKAELSFPDKNSALVRDIEYCIENVDFEYELVANFFKKFKSKILYVIAGNNFVEKFVLAGFEVVKNPSQKFSEFLADDQSLLAFYRERMRKPDASFSSIPDLIIIDGGKGQLSSAVEAFKDADVIVPICSIAKKNEDIYIYNRSEPLNLPKNSGAQYLVQRLRDEAHRFAITHNKLRREKTMIKS